MKHRRIDVRSANLGTIVTLEACTPRARRWFRDNLDAPSFVTMHCDPRCAIDILHGLLSAGFTLQDIDTGRFAGKDTSR